MKRVDIPLGASPSGAAPSPTAEPRARLSLVAVDPVGGSVLDASTSAVDTWPAVWPAEWSREPLPWEPPTPRDRSHDDADDNGPLDPHSRTLALRELHAARARIVQTSTGVKLRTAPEHRRACTAALCLLGGEAVVLAEAQAFCARYAGAVRPDDAARGGSVWDFVDLWFKRPDGSLDYGTAFRVVWLYAVAMQDRGAFPPAAYLRACGLTLPRGACSLADVAGVASVASVAEACRVGWDHPFAPNLSHQLARVWREFGWADVCAAAARTVETPDAHALSG